MNQNRHVDEERQPFGAVRIGSKQSYLVQHNGLMHNRHHHQHHQKRLVQDLNKLHASNSSSTTPLETTAAPIVTLSSLPLKIETATVTTNNNNNSITSPTFESTLEGLLVPSNQGYNPFIIPPDHQMQCQSPTRSQMNCTNQELQLLDFNPTEINFAEIQRLWISKDFLDILFRVTFVAPIVLLGIIGNLTIIYSMFKFKPFRSKPTNIFILNMAIADLLTTMVCPTAALFTDIYQFYVLGSFICRFEGFVKITCLLVSSYSLIVLSSDWLLCVVQPCRTRITTKQSWLALATIWFLSVLMASPLFVWRKLRRRIWKDLVEVWCCEMIQYTKYYWVVITFFLIYLPTFFMTVVLVIILAQMDKFEAKLRRSRSPTSSTSQGNCSLTIHMKYRRRIVKILFTYLLTSIICWTPLQFTIIYRHFRSEAIPSPWFFELAFFSQLSASLTAAMNPIIFGFLSQPFRRMVTKSLMFKFLDKIVGSKNGAKSSADNNNNNPNNNNNNNRNEIPAAKLHRQLDNNNGTRSQQQQKNQQLQHIVRVQKHPKPLMGHQIKHNRGVIINKQQATKSGGDLRANSSGIQVGGSSFKINHLQPSSNGCSLDPNNKRVSFNTSLNSELQLQQNNGLAGCDNSGFQLSPNLENKSLGTIKETQTTDSHVHGQSSPSTIYIVGQQQLQSSGKQISTTSFMQPEQHNIRRPISLVSMDSINIEENLGPVSGGEANS